MTVRSMARTVVRSLRQDVSWGVHQLVINGIAGSYLTPRLARIALYRLMGVRVDTTAIFDGCTLVGGAQITIGRDTFLNRACYLEAVGPISIGAATAVGMEVAFITSHHPIDKDGRFSVEATGLPITVGDRCWIGARATILPGVTIADDVVVAAGAVVAKDCATGGLYAGVPARRIRDLVDPVLTEAAGSEGSS